MYKNRRVSSAAIQSVIDDIEQEKLIVPKRRQPRLKYGIYIISNIPGIRAIPCKFVMEEACKRTDTAQPIIKPRDHILHDAEDYLRGNGFESRLSRVCR